MRPRPVLYEIDTETETEIKKVSVGKVNGNGTTIHDTSVEAVTDLNSRN